MKQNFAFLTISFLSSLWLGYWIGKGIVSIDTHRIVHQTDSNESVSVSSDLLKTLKFLWIGIDQLDAAPPSLKTVWWIQVEEYAPVRMIPLYPDPQQDKVKDQALQASFAILKKDSSYILSQEFLDQINPSNEWDTYLVYDEVAMKNLIDLIGGVNLGKGKLNGRRALSQINNAAQPENFLNFQTILWGEICWNITMKEVDPASLVEAYDLHSFSRPDSILKPSDWPNLLNQIDIPACSFPQAMSFTQSAQ